jgi:hypothetical protein
MTPTPPLTMTLWDEARIFGDHGKHKQHDDCAACALVEELKHCRAALADASKDTAIIEAAVRTVCPPANSPEPDDARYLCFDDNADAIVGTDILADAVQQIVGCCRAVCEAYEERGQMLAGLNQQLAAAASDRDRMDWLEANAVQISIERDSWIVDPESEETPLREWLDAAKASEEASHAKLP